jgi:hypothetical protein
MTCGELKPSIIEGYPKSVSCSYDLQMICFPQGYHIKEINETNIVMKIEVNHYSLVDSCGVQKYVSALTFSEITKEPKENYELDPTTLAIPKAFCLISSQPLFEFQK